MNRNTEPTTTPDATDAAVPPWAPSRDEQGQIHPVPTGTPPSRRRRWPWAASTAVVAVVALAGLCAATGTFVDSRLHHHTGPWPSPTEWPAVALAMISHPRDPQRWPHPATDDTTTAAAAIAGLLFLTLAGMALVLAFAIVRRSHQDGTATGAQVASLRPPAIIRSVTLTRPASLLPRWPLWRARHIGLHQYGPRLGTLRSLTRPELRCRHEDSVIAIGPPRGGKTTAVAVPRILDSPGAVVVTSTKADLLLTTAAWRRRYGRVWVLDGEGIADPLHTDWTPLRWDPVAGCADPDTAIRRASALVGARPIGSVRNADFFAAQAADILRCWLMAAALSRHRIDQLARWLHNLADPTPAELLDIPRPDWADRLRGLATNTAREMIGGIVGTLQLVLSPLDSPRILATCTPRPGENTFTIPEFLDSTDSLYLLTEGDSHSGAPFVSALVDEICHHARRASQHRPGGRLDPPLNLVLDEPGNTAATPRMPSYVSDSGGRGITLLLLPQGWGQMRSRWGQDGAHEIFNSATAALILGGAKESDFLADVSRLVGERTVTQRSTTNGGGRRTTHHADHREPTLPIGDLRTIPDGQALLLYQRLPPMLVDLPAWYRGPHARTLNAHLAAIRDARVRLSNSEA